MNSNDQPGRQGLRNLSNKSDDVAEYYDEWAADYDQTLAQWRYEAPGQAAARLGALLDPGSVILDAGCGTGLSGQALVDAGFSTIDGIDVSRRSLDVASGRGIYRSLQHVDMQKLPLPCQDDAYDGLVCIGVLTYLPDSLETLREFCRVVRPGGAMVVTQRTDVFKERDYPAVLAQLESQGLIRDLQVSDPQPYLPENEEFGDEVMVHYITCRTAE